MKNIMIIDDSADSRFVIKKILEKKGYFISETSNWMDSLLKIGEGGVDLVILDLKMDEIDGLELLKLIRKDHKGIELPILVYTAGSVYSPKECIENGANAFINKHDDPQLLAIKVQELLA